MRGEYIFIAMSALLPSLTIAQSSGAAATSSKNAAASSTSSSASSSTSGHAVHRVNVGAFGSHGFDPNITYAAKGDIVQFVFYPSNHSVIRGEYTGSDACGAGGCNPCVPYEIIHSGQAGFHSGNQITQFVSSIDSVNASAKTWNYTVESLDPVFYYCNALGSCTPNGMIGMINPNELVSINKQREAAKRAPYQLAPGEAWPAEGATPGAETATLTGFVKPTATSLSNATLSANGSGGHHTLSGGAIAGIVIAGVVVIALAAALFYFMGRSKTYKDMFKANQSETQTQTQAGGNTSQPGEGSQAGYAPAPLVAGNAGQSPHRQSQMSQYSQTPSDATFVGYNRQTGAPEFATEVPIAEHGPYQYGSTQGSPQPQQGTFAPNKRETFELPASAPAQTQPHGNP